ncbi:hypothetical protein CTAYLR_006285 [Chrysophaeum taylorii]|uniref:Bifunctional lysine-specific demethylase and histidyl-hydroxylase n=1 Tax=Chrysophaeum taylorii TaxID=2483200 RepID=A0AAD7XSH6_9STRA|nr:hypothetical protein CTAYLR_006285 [Chrysophaeum taylorii]
MILLWVWLAPARAREGLVGTGVWGERPGRTTLAALGIKVEEATLQTLATLGDPEVLEEAALSGGVDVRDRDGRIVSKKTDVGAALREGTSFVLRLEEMESSRLRPVLAAAEALGAAAAAAFLAPTTVHAYVTGKGGQALETHTDPHDVVALQIGGSKLWELCEVSTSTNETSIAMRAEIAEVELGSGGCTSRDTLRAKGLVGCEKTQLVPPEVFYVPKGVPHSAVSREFSLHVTVGIGRITWVEVFEALANNWRADDDSFRRALSTLADAPTRDIALWRAAFPTRHLTFVEESIVVSRDIDAIFADYCERLFWKAAVSTPEGAVSVS